ncbi:MAG: hypothetical protein GX843_09135 [Synergistaceae bacterium]|nr:hypothetical protein [Synergistaceae bacterium]
MFSRHFGQFLLNERIVTPGDLSRAMGRLGDARPRVGILAIAKGYMTPAQVREVGAAQRKEDKRFGKIAIDKGYLTAEKLEELLSAQKNEHVLLGQILVEDNILSHDGFLRSLELYREKSGFSSEGYEAIRDGDTDRAVASILTGQPGGQNPLIKAWSEIFVRNIIRFVDPAAALDPLAERDMKGSIVFTQSMRGDREFNTFISAKEPVMADLAQRYTDLAAGALDEIALEAIGEFLNVSNGLFTVNCSDRGVELDLLPQEQAPEDDPQVCRKPDALLPLLLPEGILWAGICGA